MYLHYISYISVSENLTEREQGDCWRQIAVSLLCDSVGKKWLHK